MSPDQPSKAQEREAERRRAEELKAAHRFALKHVKARVRREDIKKAGAGMEPKTNQDSGARGSRPDAPSFVILADSMEPASQKVDSDASSVAASRPSSRGNNAQAKGGQQQHVRAQRSTLLQGGGDSHVHDVSGQVSRAAIGTAQVTRAALKERRAGAVLQKHGQGAQAATCGGDPVVQIFLPRCSLPSQSSKACSAKATSSEPAVTTQPSAELLQSVAAAEQSPAVGPRVDELQGRAQSVRDVHAAKRKPSGPGSTWQPGEPGTGAAGVFATSAVAVTSGRRKQPSSGERVSVGCLTRSRKRSGQGSKAARPNKIGANGASSNSRTGSGSAPGRLPSPEQKACTGSSATAARVEELRIRLEAQLGAEKLLAACKSLDSDTAATSTEDVLRQLEAVLAPNPHFAYAVYRLKMMEDIVFR